MLRSESLCLVQKSIYCCLKNFEHIPNFLYLETYLKFHEQHYTHKEVSLVTVADRGWWLIAYSNCDWKQLDYFIESQIIKQKQMISTSERLAEHQFAGQNTQHWINTL